MRPAVGPAAEDCRRSAPHGVNRGVPAAPFRRRTTASAVSRLLHVCAATAGVTVAAAGFAALPQVFNPNSPIFVRPGGTSFTWSYGVGDTPNPSYPGTYPVTHISYHNVGSPINWILTRGRFETSTDNGATWSTYAHAPVGSTNYTTTAGRLWRFVDTSGADTTTTHSVGIGWMLQGVPSTITSGSSVQPDNPPTDLSTNRTTVFSNAAEGDLLATLTPTDTGSTINGYWVIDSQSVPNLFAIAFTRSTGNTAALKRGTGVMPAIGQTVTVTVRYCDLYQTDASGDPIAGQGFSKQLAFTVVQGESNELSLGSDIPVNTYTTNNQSAPALARLSSGNVVAVWQSAGQNKTSATYSGIYGQVLSSTGAKIGDEFVISNGGTTTNEISPAVAALPDGRYVVTYSVSGTGLDIGYRLVAADGTVGLQAVANATTTDDQSNSSVALLNDGSFVIAWASANGDIRARQFNGTTGAALAGEVVVADGAVSGGYYPSVTGLSNGSYAVAWVDAGTWVVKAKVAGGAAVDTGITAAGFGAPRTAALASGFVVASDFADYETNEMAIKAVRFDNSAVIQGSVFTVNTGTGGQYRYAPSVVTLSGGGFLISWNADDGDYEYNGIFGRRYSAEGTAIDATEVPLNQLRAGDQSYPVLAPLADDAFAVAWVDTIAASVAAGENFGDIEARFLLPPNNAPTFVGSTTTLSVHQNASATDVKDLLHAADTDASQTLTWTVASAPGHGTLSAFTGATAGSGGTDITPGGTLTYTPAAAYFGSDSFTIQVSDGQASASRTISVTVSDVTAPTVVSVARVAPSGQFIGPGTTSVVFRVTYSEAVTNISDANFALEGVNGSSITGTVTDVSGTGTTRDVTVTITSGSGEFRLRVID